MRFDFTDALVIAAALLPPVALLAMTLWSG